MKSLLFVVAVLGAVGVDASCVAQQGWGGLVPPNTPSSLGSAIVEIGDLPAGPPVQSFFALGDPVRDLVIIATDTGTGVHQISSPFPPGSRFGHALAVVEHLGAPPNVVVKDLVVGAPLANNGAGAVVVYRFFNGSVPTPLTTLPTLPGNPDDHFGASIAGIGALPPIQGAGVFVVGSPDHDGNGIDSGCIQIYRGNGGGSNVSLLFTALGGGAGHHMGFSVAGGGYVNGDSVPDYLAGSPGAASLGSETGSVTVFSGADHAVLAIMNGAEVGSRFGHALAMVGDCNCDGFGDFVIGAPGSNLRRGRATVFGGSAGMITPMILYDQPGLTDGVSLGWSVSAAGDATGDGLPDLIIAEGDHQPGSNFAQTPLVARVIQGGTGGLTPNSSLQISVGCQQNLTTADKFLETPTPGSIPASGWSDNGTPFVCGPAGGQLATISALQTGSVPIQITLHPASQTVCVFAPVTFSVAATWSGPLGYEWRKDGIAITGANASTLTIASVTTPHTGSYEVRVHTANSSGVIPCQWVTSLPATLSLLSSQFPAITVQPQSQERCAGDFASLTVVASGSIPFSYQWRKNGTPMPGSPNAATYTIPSLTVAHAGSYDVVVINSCGAVTSTPAILTVHPGFRLLIDQSPGPGSLRIRVVCGTVSPPTSYFTALSFDQANVSSPGAGWWGGLWIPLPVLVDEWGWFVEHRPPFWGNAGFATLVLPPGTIPPAFSGQTISGVTIELTSELLVNQQSPPVSLLFP